MTVLLPICSTSVIVVSPVADCMMMYNMHEANLQLGKANKLHSILAAKAERRGTNLLVSRWDWRQASKWQSGVLPISKHSNGHLQEQHHAWSITCKDDSRRMPAFFCFSSSPMPSTCGKHVAQWCWLVLSLLKPCTFLSARGCIKCDLCPWWVYLATGCIGLQTLGYIQQRRLYTVQPGYCPI